MTEPVYEPQDWHNKPAADTPLDAERFSVMENGIAVATQRAAASIRYDQPQTLTEPEQATAAANLGLGSASTIDSANLLTLVVAARNPDLLISGAITRDANGVATSAAVTWPDGTPGLYTADVVSSVVPAVDGYHITYGSPVIRTYTQPAVTRDPASGVVTAVPAIVVS